MFQIKNTSGKLQYLLARRSKRSANKGCYNDYMSPARTFICLWSLQTDLGISSHSLQNDLGISLHNLSKMICSSHSGIIFWM